MRLSTQFCITAFAVLICSNLSIAQQNQADESQEIFIASAHVSSYNAFIKFFSIHLTPTKAICGELPVTLSARISNSIILEAGAGPAFRDRVAQKIFDGKTLQHLSFQNKNATYNTGVIALFGMRYLLTKKVLEGFYANPEFSFAQRNVSYPIHQRVSNDKFDGHIREFNVRLLLGFDRALCPYADRIYYGGFFGFGMRRYDAVYFDGNNKIDPGTRRSVEMLPTLHLGYRIGYSF